MSDFINRFKKNNAARATWARREKTNAYRVYDLDIPEWPYSVDWYAGWAHVVEYPSRKQRRDDGLATRRAEVLAAVQQTLGVPEAQIVFKRHEPIVWGEGPPAAPTSTPVQVEEHGLKFECDLGSHQDTGLFLDHRPTRARVRQEAKGKRVLNLFAYTGAFTVHAIAGGAVTTTSVDLSNTYCAWAERNLAHNGTKPSAQHQIIRADVLAWLERAKGPYELIVLDPPTFSTSKKMSQRFEIQRDHLELIECCLELLTDDGTLYFSTNFLEFRLHESLEALAKPLASLPPDFRRQVHSCWQLRRTGSAHVMR